jgi:hypothetical protein
MNAIRFNIIKILITSTFFFVVFMFAIQAQAATLSASPVEGPITIGDTFTVEILLDTEGENTDGVDIKYLNFDPDLLEVQEVVSGTLYPSTQVNEFDNTVGTINFAQVTTAKSKYNGSGVLATITFLVKSKSRKATLDFDFELGNTIDTNVASGGTDVLTSVENGMYKLGSSQGFWSSIIEFFRNLFTSS